jgi:hypothetical protein
MAGEGGTIMMVPSIFKDNLFDSFFNDDFFWP